MSLRINFNLSSLQSQRGLSASQFSGSKAAEQLATGLRINRASDDPAGMAVSTKLKVQIQGLNQAQRNVQDGINTISIAEGALSQIHSILARMRELAVQASNDTLTNSDRDQSDAEFTSLRAEITRIGDATQYASVPLLNGLASAFNLQIGANTADFLAVEFPNATVTGIENSDAYTGTDPLPDPLSTAVLTSQVGSNAAIAPLDAAIEVISGYRSALGAMTNRLQSTSDSLGVTSENVAAANSRIQDTDMAAAMSEMVRSQILQQAGIAVLAQANQAPQAVLKLLQ
jgi:flagellin